MKICSNCGIEKELEEFSNRKTSKDGKRSWCKVCDKLYREANRDTILPYLRDYHHKNKEKSNKNREVYRKNHSEQENSRHREWSNKTGKSKEYAHRFCIDNPDRRREICHKYYINNKPKFLHNDAKRRSRLLNQIPPDVRWDKIKMYYQVSEYLGSDWEVDHIVPVSNGGFHHQDNLHIVLKTENRQKGNKENFQFTHSIKI